MKAITVRQPWAWLIFHGKPVENRDWWTGYRGPLAIHAGKGMTRQEYRDAVQFVKYIAPEIVIPPADQLIRGAVIGTTDLVDCVRDHPSPFFQGEYGFVLVEHKLFCEPVFTNGALGLWEWNAETPCSRA